jgi:hypothetical protein
MARGKAKVVKEMVYVQMCAAIDTDALVGIHASLQRSVDVALEGELAVDARQEYTRRVLRRAWQRLGEIVFDVAPELEAPP